MPPKQMVRFGPSQIHFQLTADTKFDDMVRVLETALTLPPVGRFRGCAPCMTGIERFVLEDPAFRELQRGQIG